MYLALPNKSIDFSYHRRRMVKGSDSSGDFPKRDMHPEYELLLALDSGVSYAIENQKYKLSPYALLIIPSNAYHYPIPEPPYTGYYDRYMLRCNCSYADASLLHSVFRHPACYQLTADHPIVLNFRQLHEFAQSDIPEYKDLMLKTVCNKILLDIYLFQKTALSDAATPTASYPVLAYIEENLASIRSVDQIAEHFFLSPSTLAHQFRSRMGISLMKYIRQKRLLLAYSLLRKGEKPLTVAAMCGFREYTTFYKAYTGHFGFPPSKKD